MCSATNTFSLSSSPGELLSDKLSLGGAGQKFREFLDPNKEPGAEHDCSELLSEVAVQQLQITELKVQAVSD